MSNIVFYYSPVHHFSSPQQAGIFLGDEIGQIAF